MNLTKELLSVEIPSLSPSDTGETVLSLMEEHKVGHLALVENGKYLCLVSERDAYRMETPESELGRAWYFAPSVKISDTLLDALDRMTSNNLSVLPAVSEENDYLGVVSQSHILKALSDLLGTDKPGSIFVIEVSQEDFLASEIARIVESNNAQLVNLYTYASTSGNLQVAIKVNVDDAEQIARSFERFNLKVLMTFSSQGVVDEVAQERWQELFYYINM
ncbi:MAG: CBS domain-containing protein [Bacteroidales bacterium]|nr:CBS domain-containing protein [Bacteroidales bacterium]